MATNTTALEKPTMTVNEVAEYLGVHPGTVYEYIYQGVIPATRLGRGRKWIISRQFIEDFVRNAPAIPITERD